MAKDAHNIRGKELRAAQWVWIIPMGKVLVFNFDISLWDLYYRGFCVCVCAISEG